MAISNVQAKIAYCSIHNVDITFMREKESELGKVCGCVDVSGGGGGVGGGACLGLINDGRKF